MENKATEVDILPDQDAIDKAVAEAVEKANAANAEQLKLIREQDKAKRDKLDKQLKDLKAKLAAVEEKPAESSDNSESEALKEEVKELRRQLAMSGEAVVTFKLFFATWQNDYSKMLASLAQTDEETRAKLRAAIKKQMEGWSNAE